LTSFFPPLSGYIKWQQGKVQSVSDATIGWSIINKHQCILLPVGIIA